MATLEEKVQADIAALEDGATTLTATVTKYNEAKKDTAGASVTTALVALAKAGREDNVAAVEHVQGKLDNEVDRELLEMILASAEELANKLAVSLDTLDMAAWTTAAERVKGYAPLLEDEMAVAAGTALTHWTTAKASFEQASGANVKRQTGRGRPGGLSGPQRGPTGGTRGVGKWWEDHGWFFTAACPHCDHVVQSASNTGSFAHEMAKHMGKHREDGVRPYDGDAEYDHARDAMYEIADDNGPDMVTTAEGWVVERNYTEANAA
jgi:hypothetical protein